MIRYVFWEELKKAMGNRQFLMIILAVAALSLLVPVVTPEGEMTNGFLLLAAAQEELEMYEFSSVAAQMQGGYFIMFIPLLTGLALLPVLCGDRETGMFRYLLVRSGKKKVLIGKLLTSLLCAGIAVMAGFLLAELILAIRIAPEAGKGQTVVSMAMGAFAYGAVCGLWTYLAAALIRNRYLLACTPYILFWFVNRLSTQLNLGNQENGALSFLIKLVNASYSLNLFLNWEWFWQTLAADALLAVLAFGLWMAVWNRRTDCGE